MGSIPCHHGFYPVPPWVLSRATMGSIPCHHGFYPVPPWVLSRATMGSIPCPTDSPTSHLMKTQRLISVPCDLKMAGQEREAWVLSHV
ncbi:hypothetical protein Atep_30790 (plasmid) [Allochromatium tepidum]|uniref:Uncharacterized protein n=1 Tax=Allochromatium tepidum TaxID=553982 RepID=A0ABM7QQQ1_9GAMM|nr:hypothetical protein Atep_30350 [Allochromatium tepidum]BCU08402.1 hypothetical protein Atep_30790 [Allochromatium tepidum]